MGNQHLRSVGQRQRDSDAHDKIVSGVKELARLLHLPASIFERIESARHRDAFLQLMLEREALAEAVAVIIEAVKEREGILSDHADLPEDLPGRMALIRAGYTSRESLKVLSESDLVTVEGIGAAKARAIHATLHRSKTQAKVAEKKPEPQEVLDKPHPPRIEEGSDFFKTAEEAQDFTESLEKHLRETGGKH